MILVSSAETGIANLTSFGAAFEFLTHEGWSLQIRRKTKSRSVCTVGYQSYHAQHSNKSVGQRNTEIKTGSGEGDQLDTGQINNHLSGEDDNQSLGGKLNTEPGQSDHDNCENQPTDDDQDTGHGFEDK